MDIEDIINRLNSPDGDETVYDDLRAGYADVSNRADNAAAKIEELTAANAALNEEVSRLKAANYDLLTALPSDNNSAPPPADDGDDSEDGKGAEDITIDDLFTQEDDE